MRVVERPPTVEALQLTENNEDEIASTVGTYRFRRSSDTQPAAIMSPTGTPTPVYVGNWVVLTLSGPVVLTQVDFDERYVPAPA